MTDDNTTEAAAAREAPAGSSDGGATDAGGSLAGGVGLRARHTRRRGSTHRGILSAVPVVALLAVGGVALWYFVLRGEESAISVAPTTTTVTDGNLAITLSATGSASAMESSKLRFGVSGTISDLAVVNGALVKAGDVIATATDSGQAQQQLQTAAATLASAKSALEALTTPSTTELLQAKKTVNDATATATMAKSTRVQARLDYISALTTYCNIYGEFCYQGIAPLTDEEQLALTESLAPTTSTFSNTSHIAAAQTLLEANNSYVSATTAYENAVADIGLANAQLDALTNPNQADADAAQSAVDQAQAVYDQQKLAIDNMTLKAPFDGVIAGITKEVGDPVQPSDVIATVFDPQSVAVDLSIGETDLPSVKVGQYALVTFDAISDHPFLAKITSIDPTGTASQGVVSYTARTQILTGDDAQAVIQTVAAAFTTRSRPAGGFTGPGGGPPGAAGTDVPSSSTTPNPSGTPGASGTPDAAASPGGRRNFNGAGAGGFGGASVFGTGGIEAVVSPPVMPSPGMSGTATVITQTYTNILLVPSAALRRSGGNEVVVAVGPDGSLIEQAVQTGITNGSQTEIVAGVDSGTTIVANVASLANNSSDSSQTGTASGQPTGQGFPGGGFPGGGFGGPGGVDTGNGGVVQ